MKRKMMKVAICMVMCLVFVLSSAIVSSADGTHGFFMTCPSSVTNGKTDGFMMDFYSDSDNALCTYWSNANWSMYTGKTVKKFGYISFKGGGAYAGLQIGDTPADRRGIMSMWRYEYLDLKTKETKYIYAKALYGKTTTYDNEGSGTSCVMKYDWKSSQWYRELLLCWEDEETGYTLIGTWFYDYEADKWTLFAYYNTFLVESYISGDIGQFLENFVESTRENYRSFRYRNIYMLPHGETDWVSCPTVHLRSDANPKAWGEAKLGVSEDGTYVWASVDGRSEVDTDELLEIRPTLVQAAKPTLGDVKIAEFTARDTKSQGTKVNWTLADNSTPQLSYKLIVKNENGDEIAKASGTRPEVNELSIGDLGTDAYKCELTVTDVFGKSVSAEFTSENYGKSDTTPEPTNKPSDTAINTQAPATDSETGDENAPEASNAWIIYTVISAVVLAGAGAVLTIVLKKKKK